MIYKTKIRRHRGLGDTVCAITANGARLCTDSGSIQASVAASMPTPAIAPASSSSTPSSTNYYLATTTAAERARQDVILNTARPGRPSRTGIVPANTVDASNVTQPADAGLVAAYLAARRNALILRAIQSAPAAAVSNAAATTASTATSLFSAIPPVLTDSTWISGVPNYLVIGGGALLAFFISRKRR